MSKYIQLPPIRKLVLPDPGHIIFDVDQSGADAQVVAWEANDHKLMSAFKAGLDIHNFNGRTIWGDAYQPKLVRRKLEWRNECKRSVHGTNYLAGAVGLAKILGWTFAEVDTFQHLWFHEHPGIKDWHRRVDYGIQQNGKVLNSFNNHIIYFDRPQNILPKAVAWIPQSTVATVCEKAAVRLRKTLPWCNVKMQVHDSVIFQLPYHRVTVSNLQTIRRHLEIECPYKPEPLIIPWGLKYSKQSWGDCTVKMDWDTLEPVKKAA